MTKYYQLIDSDFNLLGVAAERNELAVVIFRDRIITRTGLLDKDYKNETTQAFFENFLKQTKRFINNELKQLK